MATEYDRTVEVLLEGWDTETVQFNGSSGDRISIGMTSSWTAAGMGRLYAPGSEEPMLEDDLYAWGASEPVTLSTNGTYVLELVSMTGYDTSFEVTIHRAEVVTGELEVDGATSRSRLGVGDSLWLSMQGTAGDVVSVWPPALQEYSEVDGFYDSTMKLVDPGGTVVWDSTTGSDPYQPVMESVALPSTGSYTLKVNPWLGAEGHLALKAARVPALTIPLQEDERAGVELTVPGQDAEFTFTAQSGQWIRLSVPVVPYDADLVLKGPGNQTWTASPQSDGFNDLLVPQTGTYVLRVKTHLSTGEVRARYREVAAPLDVVLPMDGTPRTVTPTTTDRRVRFVLEDSPNQELDIKITSGGTARGTLLRFDPAAPAGFGYGDLDAGESQRVEFWDEGDLAGDYGVFFTPFEGSTGPITARVTAPLTDPEPVYGAIVANQGVVELSSPLYELTAEVEPGTTYRLRTLQDQTAETHVSIAGEELYVSSMVEAPESIVEFSTPAGTGPTEVQISVSRRPTNDEAGTTDGGVELYTSASTPDFQSYAGPVAPTDLQVRWAVDAISEPIDGYAVLVDQNPDSDPGTAVTHPAPSAAPQLTPGDYWIHVRAIDDAQAGPVAHARVVVAEPGVASAPAAPHVSPGTPGLIVTDAPTLTLAVPPALIEVDSVRFLVSGSNRRTLWSGASAIDEARASLTMPAGVLSGEGPFEARAQYVDHNGSPSITGPAASFVVDRLAPQSPAPACSGRCVPVSEVLFDGTLAGVSSQLLDIEDLTDIGAGNWADSIDLEVAATGSGDALVRFYSGIPDLENDDATLLVPAGSSASVRVVPDDIYRVTVMNSDDQGVDVRVTAVGWTPAIDETREAAREAAIEELTDEFLARGESFAGQQPAVVDEYDSLPEPVCAEDGTCTAIVAPGDPSPFEPDGQSTQGGTPHNAAEQGRNQAKFAATTPLSSALEAEELDCDTGSPEGYWVVQDRFSAVGSTTRGSSSRCIRRPRPSRSGCVSKSVSDSAIRTRSSDMRSKSWRLRSSPLPDRCR